MGIINGIISTQISVLYPNLLHQQDSLNNNPLEDEKTGLRKA